MLLKEVFDKIYENPDSKDSRVFVSLYEQNKAIIENADITNDEWNRYYVVQLMADYALSLSYVGSISKSLPYFDKVIPLVEARQISEKKKPFDLPLYEKLIWNRATTLHNLKKYDLAAKEFEKLVINFPDNDKYRNWLRGSQAFKLNKISNVCVVIGVAGCISNYISPKGLIWKIELYIAIAAIAAYLILQLLIYLKKIRK
jgi:hypothetical protein